VAVRVFYQGRSFGLEPGAYLIGRGADCQLTLDDSMVSRHHALLTVRPDGASIEDLGSRNGVTVNGRDAAARTELRDGDQIVIGTQQLGVRLEPGPLCSGDAGACLTPPQRMRFDAAEGGVMRYVITTTLPGLRAGTASPERREEGFAVLVGLADQALRDGQVEQAERVLERPLAEVVSTLRAGLGIDEPSIAFATCYAMRLVEATRKGFWLDYLFDLHSLLGRMMPGALVASLERVAPGVRGADRGCLRAYAETLARGSGRMGQAEQALLERIARLETLLGAA
jgi:pSer/pThr/pTyr-binding forkhead associated (FHA) protein